MVPVTPQVSVQTYTLRQYLKKPKTIEKTLITLSDLGINAIELARIKFTPAEIDIIQKVCASHSITVGSTQITFDYLKKNIDWVVEFHKKLSCSNVCVSVLPTSVILGGQSKWIDFSKSLNELGERYSEYGLHLLFHHHDFEFRKYNGQKGLDIIVNNTNPKHVGLVLDTYWTQRGGCSPENLILDLSDRVKIVHLRDYYIQWKYLDLRPTDCELGAGNLDIARIVESCKKSSVEFMAIEQTTNKPFDSIKQSADHLKKLGFSDLF